MHVGETVMRDAYGRQVGEGFIQKFHFEFIQKSSNFRDVNNSCYISPTHLEFVQKDPIIHLPRPNGSAPFDDLDLL